MERLVLCVQKNVVIQADGNARHSAASNTLLARRAELSTSSIKCTSTWLLSGKTKFLRLFFELKSFKNNLSIQAQTNVRFSDTIFDFFPCISHC